MIALCIAVLFALASGQSLSICDRYSIAADKADQTKWLQDIVVEVFTQITTGPANPDLRYFNGAFPHFLPVSTNFTSPASATKLGNLVNGLITFFGGALGCSSITPGTFNIKDIHKNMYVNAEAQQFFIDTLITVLGSSKGRNVNNVDLATIKSVLDSLTPQIVVPTACSQFNSYNKGFSSESDMMLRIVTNFAGLVTQTGTFTKRYFDGRQPAGSTNLAAGGQPLVTHLDHVFKYFGGPGWASCLGSDFPDYTFELDNKIIHANMGITNTTFNQWVKLHVQAISSTTGLTTPDLAGYEGTLNSFRDVVVTSPDSICDKYAWALGVSTQSLVNTVVSGTIQAVLTNSITSPYFNGRQPVGSTDFTNQANGQKATALQNGLISFFGAALGCKDDTIPAYTGPSMQIVHAAMGVTDQVFEEFNRLVVGVLAKAGVTATDQNAVAQVLESLRPDIVQGSVAREAAICPKYSSALKINNQQLVSTVVDKTVAAVAANPLTAPFFNGAKPAGSTNFLDAGNANLLKTLDNSLVAFFGGVLGCSDGTIPAYTGGDLKTVHSKMGITPSAFDAFNYELLNVMSTLGVSSGDVAAVGTLLESTRSSVQATYNSETFQPYYLSAGAIVGIIFGALILAALFAGLCVLLTMNEKSLPKLH